MSLKFELVESYFRESVVSWILNAVKPALREMWGCEYRYRSKKWRGRRVFILVGGCIALAQHANEKVKYPLTKAMSEYTCRRRKKSVFSPLRHNKEERKRRTKKIDNDDQQKCRERRAKGINMSVAK